MSKKILVIDDERTIRLLLENFLSKSYEVIAKEDGKEALGWLEGNLPDLIICDIDMPVMGGYEFLERVRNGGFTKHIPVVMLSAKENSGDRIKCYKLKAQDFLVKPFNPEELSELIKKNLEPIHYAVKW